MGTEVAISFTTLRTQLENEKSSLFKIDENIKKIVQTTGRFVNDRFNASGDYLRGGNRLGGRNSFPDSSNIYKNDEHFGKRKQETKTVFSRLSARAQDSDGEDDGPGSKRTRVPSAVSRELPTRAAVLRAQGDDEQARKRNRRIFGSLLGTLQKFKQEEIVLQTKEEKKALVERKIEEQARLEKEREQKERKTLFAEREHKKATIKALEAKMGRVQEFEKWETSQKNLSNFILTRTNPPVYWLPKKMNDKASEKLASSRKFHEKYLINKRQELQDELHRIEQRCLRPRGPGVKENDISHDEKQDKGVEEADVEMKDVENKDGERRKRDKFAMDADVHDESDGETQEDEHIREENKMDTSTEQKSADIHDNNMTVENNESAVENGEQTTDEKDKPTGENEQHS